MGAWICARTSDNLIYQVNWQDSSRSLKSNLGRNFEKIPTSLMDFEIVWVLLGFWVLMLWGYPLNTPRSIHVKFEIDPSWIGRVSVFESIFSRESVHANRTGPVAKLDKSGVMGFVMQTGQGMSDKSGLCSGVWSLTEQIRCRPQTSMVYVACCNFYFHWVRLCSAVFLVRIHLVSSWLEWTPIAMLSVLGLNLGHRPD